jgi:hypothetical protein
MDEEAAVTVQHAAQIIERPADVDIGNIEAALMMSGQRLLEARALLRRFAVPLRYP